MVTREQAETAQEFHENGASNCDGTCRRWRRNGQTQTWKRQPDRFRIPVKHGMYAYGAITEENAGRFHAAEDCASRGGLL